ncbi:MAG: 2-oxo acid dehydrogenase subunit E2 [Burkholderiales bacterium]|nr:2-oxo acid dehydrogenase subunit E2 [Burkholderiales bacterium]
MSLIEVTVPDIGDFTNVPVIEVLVKAGDSVEAEDALVTLESDKATMDVPSPAAGVVKEVAVRAGDRVSEGSLVLVLEASAPAAAPSPQPSPASGRGGTPAAAQPSSPLPLAGEGPGVRDASIAHASPAAAQPASPLPLAGEGPGVRDASTAHPSPAAAQPSSPLPLAGEGPGVRDASTAHASPSVRKFARELGVDIARIAGSGPKSRILYEDVQAFVKGVMRGAPAAANLARNGAMTPCATQFDEADITGLEALRVALDKEYEKAGVRVTMLAFLIKVCVHALQRFPDFNASLDGDGPVRKRYFHIGFAIDTPNGPVVPVLKDADQKGVLAIAKETGELAAQAREGKLAPSDMQGGCFSISSLGGIGGTAFTPIVNAPEVATLGVSKSATKPVWDGGQFVPRLMLPLSLSYDHRVIDSAAAARFTAHVAALLADLRRAVV